jgi:hypothetical protein
MDTESIRKGRLSLTLSKSPVLATTIQEDLDFTDPNKQNYYPSIRQEDSESIYIDIAHNLLIVLDRVSANILYTELREIRSELE